MLKQELHQTILAHNHNADLIKHHKDTIDALRTRCDKLCTNTGRSSEIQKQLSTLDQRLKQQQKTRKLEPLFERLSALEQRVPRNAAVGYAGYAGMQNLGMPGIAPQMTASGMLPGMMAPGAGAVGS